MYKQNINKQFRVKCIGLIDKILSVMPEKKIEEHIRPDSLAQLALQIFKNGTGQQILICLKIIKRVFQANTGDSVIKFKREGASTAILELKNEQKLTAIDKEAQ
jgi:hypothetical protein